MNELEAAVDKYDEENFLCGTILITRNNTVLLEKAYGKASIQLHVAEYDRH